MNGPNFTDEIHNATAEVFGGTAGTWLTKLALGVLAASIHAIETATLSIASFAFLCIFDAILGAMRQVKRNRNGVGDRADIKVWRLVSGPAAKWFVGMVVLMCGSFFDLVLFGHTPWLGGPLMMFFSGILLGTIIVEVAAKADYLQGWGISDRLQKRFPEFFSQD